MTSPSWRAAGAFTLSAALAACGNNEIGAALPAKTAASLLADTTQTLASTIDRTGLVPLSDTAPPQTARRFDASTVSADGAVIAFTVYVPDIPAGNAAPLLLEGHGWGGKRTRDLDTTSYDAAANTPLQTARLALAGGAQGGKAGGRGWYVISFDQRGFGDSGGFANVMDPDIEGRDVRAIIDWAQANLPRLAHRRNRDGVLDPVVGGVGLSYGGGFQTIGAGVDKRIDAIVPTSTWYDLRYSLYDMPKSEYLALLVGVGTAGLGRAQPFTYQAFIDASIFNRVSPNFSQTMYRHSAVSYCENNSASMRTPGIPAFFIQSSNDILFNLNEGFDAFQCYRKANPDSKFMAVRYGHPDVLVSNTSWGKFTEENVSCGGASIPVARLAFSFLSQNLVDARLNAGHSADYLTVPDLRAVLEDGSAVNGPKGETAEGGCHEVAKLGSNPSGAPLIQRGGVSATATPSSVQNVVAGVPALLAPAILPNDPATLASPLMKSYTGPEAGTVVRLAPPSGSARKLLGTPTVTLTVTPTNALQAAVDNPPILFLGLVRKSADGRQQLVHNQVQPVLGFGTQTVTLPGVSMLLHGSDELGLVVFGYHPQYFNYYSRIPLSVNLSGISAGLPFVH